MRPCGFPSCSRSWLCWCCAGQSRLPPHPNRCPPRPQSASRAGARLRAPGVPEQDRPRAVGRRRRAAAAGADPAFYGCYDWHSSVHGHWLLARLARLYPEAPFAPRARAALAAKPHTRSISPPRCATSRAPDASPSSGRTASPGCCSSHAELRGVGRARKPAWAPTLDPLARLAAARLTDWLPKLTRPIRVGEHDQTAFALGLALDWARDGGRHGERPRSSTDRVRRFYLADRDCPLAYEPSGHDFLSPCLAEADVVRRVLRRAEFAALARRLPARSAARRPRRLARARRGHRPERPEARPPRRPQPLARLDAGGDRRAAAARRRPPSALLAAARRHRDDGAAARHAASTTRAATGSAASPPT